MKRDFIPYKQTVYLKKLGYNKPSIGTISKEENIEIWDSLITNIELDKLTKELNDETPDKKTEPIFCAILYQQAFRWVRTKYSIGHIILIDEWPDRFEYELRPLSIEGEEDPIINSSYDLEHEQEFIGGGGTFDDDYVYADSVDNLISSESSYKTYEEAEFACLNELIKLIKN
jgi:hypothetical protein